MTMIMLMFDRYADKSDEVAIENAVRDMQRMEAAKKRYLSGGQV